MSDRWQAGDRIANRWHVHDVLPGPCGAVYVVYDEELGEVLAAKALSGTLLESDRILAHRLKKEALPWMKLERHQNVVQTRFIQSIDGSPLLFLEYIPGTSLAQWIGSSNLIDDPVMVLQFAIQLCDGMDYVQSNSVGAHRDIKPENCLITANNILKVTDFGLARALDDTLAQGIDDARVPARPRTRADLVDLVRSHRPGQPPIGFAAGAYMAPEQFASSKHVDGRADIYAFGVLLFQMLTGKLPFAAASWREYEQLHRTAAPPPLPEKYAFLSDVVRTCLAKEAPSRFTDFAAVRKPLADLYASLTGQACFAPAPGEELEAEARENQGMALMRFGRGREALVQFERALELNPDMPSLWAHKGETLCQLGESDEALVCHEVSTELDPGCTAAWYQHGVTLRMLERFTEALVCHERALELDPRCWAAWIDKGLVLAALGQRKAEMECYDRVLELNPRFLAAWRNKAIALRLAGLSDREITCYDRILEIEPWDEDAWYNKGIAFGSLGRYPQELACYDHILEFNPGSERAWTNRGIVLGELGDINEELQCYDRALTINSSYTQAWFNKGVALANSERMEEALTCLIGAQRLGHPKAAGAIAVLRREPGDQRR